MLADHRGAALTLSTGGSDCEGQRHDSHSHAREQIANKGFAIIALQVLEMARPHEPTVAGSRAKQQREKSCRAMGAGCLISPAIRRPLLPADGRLANSNQGYKFETIARSREDCAGVKSPPTIKNCCLFLLWRCLRRRSLQRPMCKIDSTTSPMPDLANGVNPALIEG